MSLRDTNSAGEHIHLFTHVYMAGPDNLSIDQIEREGPQKEGAMKTLMILCVMLLASACAGGTGDRAAATAAGTTSASIVAALRDAGLEVRDAGTVEQPFFGVPAHVYVVDGRDLQLYEFASADAAERAAAQVAPAGSPIGTAMVTWMAPPHFFRKDRLIANYIGTSERVLAELQRLFGPQFAGR